jgi:peptide/nickel transport system permease protein
MKFITRRKDKKSSKTRVDQDPSNPKKEKETKIFVATQWQLIWWRFRRHKVAMFSAVVVILIYLTALFVEILAPFDPQTTNSKYLYTPPQAIHLWDSKANKLDPYVYGIKSTVDTTANRRIFTVDLTKKIPIRLFAESDPYKLWGLITLHTKLFGPEDKTQPMFLLGGDRLGRDLLSRIIYGTRISMSIGFFGVVISLFLGILLGGISGYFGGAIDTFIQRVIEFIRSIPTIPLWMGLAAALPMNWPPLQVYFGITLILSLIGWTGLARVVRSRFLAMRGEDFVLAAELDGASELRVIFHYMMPSFSSHIIAATTLAIPAMILAETSLSFLGLGLRPPIVSWGVLLKDAQSVRSVLTAPWQLYPAVAVIISVLALNFLGDGLRDAADPYSR